MSLPSTIILPLRVNYQDEEDIERYQTDLVKELEGMYEDIADNVNGFIRNDTEADQAKWTPTLNGTNAGTFTYTAQVGWSIRQGIYTTLYFDITWNAIGTAAGNLYLELPYRVTLSSGMPFVGVLQPSSIGFGAGNTNLVINAIPNTYRGEVWSIGSAAATANLAVPATGRLAGHLTYIGLQDE